MHNRVHIHKKQPLGMAESWTNAASSTCKSPPHRGIFTIRNHTPAQLRHSENDEFKEASRRVPLGVTQRGSPKGDSPWNKLSNRIEHNYAINL